MDPKPKPDPKVLRFPIEIPGYGMVQNYQAWLLFLEMYMHLCQAYKRVTTFLDTLTEDEELAK